MPRILEEHEFEELIIDEINYGGSGDLFWKCKKKLKANSRTVK